MPKQIDHDAYREDLARRATPLFSEHGYSGLGMRAIASALGVSKSALYHYFPTKRDLFLACTRQITPGPEAALPPGETAAARLVGWTEALAPGFGAEMALLFDYLRGKDAAAVATDPAMRLALERFEAEADRLAPGKGREVLALALGVLLAGHFSGGGWAPAEFERAFAALLNEDDAAPPQPAPEA